MDAQTLGALANIVKEAIAEAVAPLQDRITELEGREIVAPEALAPLREKIKAVGAEASERLGVLEARQLPDAYDDAGLVARVAKQLEDFRSELPKAYDDSELREQVNSVRADMSRETEALLGRIKEAAYDDTGLREWLGEQLKTVPPAYDDTELRAELARVSKAAHTVYSDFELREEIKSLHAAHGDFGSALNAISKAQTETANFVAKLCDRPDPRDGAPGADGRDAIQIELLPAIDPSKSYPRGTYAKHNGGTWRAYEQTHGMRGWECTQDGVAAIVPKLEGKSLVLTIVQSSGTESMLVADLPIQEYKGVWSEQDYAAHDTVTWAGSLWHCNKTATAAKPGDGSTDWTLAVKKGRDGREVVSVPREQKPVQIGDQNA